MDDKTTRVAIAVVEADGRYLVGTRSPGQPLSGRAEFPGGKCLPDEEFSACAVRECREETGLDVTAIRRLYGCRHEYSHATLDIEFWHCRLVPPGAAAAIGRGWEWTSAKALQSLPFPEANGPVIGLLAYGGEIAS